MKVYLIPLSIFILSLLQHSRSYIYSFRNPHINLNSKIISLSSSRNNKDYFNRPGPWDERDLNSLLEANKAWLVLLLLRFLIRNIEKLRMFLYLLKVIDILLTIKNLISLIFSIY